MRVIGKSLYWKALSSVGSATYGARSDLIRIPGLVADY